MVLVHVQPMCMSASQSARVKVFSGLRDDIRRLMAEMGHEPETSLERESVCIEADVFLLTHENIKALKMLLCQVSRGWGEGSISTVHTQDCSVTLQIPCCVSVCTVSLFFSFVSGQTLQLVALPFL